MGGGNSGLFTGTVGSSPSYYRPTFTEINHALMNDSDTVIEAGGAIGGISKKKKLIKSYLKPVDVLLMIANYRSGALSIEDFQNWLKYIYDDPLTIMELDLRLIIFGTIGELDTAKNEREFELILKRLEKKMEALS